MTLGRTVALVSGLVVALAFAPTTATAAECTWEQSVLPLPAGHTSGYVGGAANGGWFVGSGETTDGVRWHNGQVEVLGPAFGTQVMLTDVNVSGVAVGTNYTEGSEDGAVVHRNGRFELLPIPPGRRMGRAFRINDAGDIVGTARSIGDNFDLAYWPAASPGTVQMINPDPAAYGYVAPIDIDEQGRILLRADAMSSDYFVRYPDGTMTKLPLSAAFAVNAFRNGRIAGEQYVNGKFRSFEWDLTGQVVRELDVRVREAVVDSGTLTAGIYRTADKGYALGVWDGAVLTKTLIAAPTNTLSRPVITDDGVIATALDSGEVVTFRRMCG